MKIKIKFVREDMTDLGLNDLCITHMNEKECELNERVPLEEFKRFKNITFSIKRRGEWREYKVERILPIKRFPEEQHSDKFHFQIHPDQIYSFHQDFQIAQC